MDRRVGLRPLLMGQSLLERDGDPTLTTLDSHIEALADLLPKVYGSSEPAQQAEMEVRKLVQLSSDRDGVICKRAALLFALLREKEPVRYFADQESALLPLDSPRPSEPTFAEDMRERVLPFIVPRYLRNSCQAPDAFVTLACVLAELWPGEPLGNWPLPPELGGRA
jgi:hypothetical protein